MQSEMPLPTANYQLPTANSSLMNLTSPSQVKDWCIRNKFHPNRVLGQNFLIDKNALALPLSIRGGRDKRDPPALASCQSCKSCQKILSEN